MSLSPKLRETIKTTLSYASLGGGWSAFLLAVQYALLSVVLHGSNFGNCNYNSWEADDETITIMSIPSGAFNGGIVGLVGGLAIAYCAAFILRKMGESEPNPKNVFIAVLLVASFGWLGMIIGGAIGWLQDIYYPIPKTWFAPYSNQQTISGLTLGLILGIFFGIAFGGAFAGITERILKSIMRGFRRGCPGTP